jgi:hypothetical protein
MYIYNNKFIYYSVGNSQQERMDMYIHIISCIFIHKVMYLFNNKLTYLLFSRKFSAGKNR